MKQAIFVSTYADHADVLTPCLYDEQRKIIVVPAPPDNDEPPSSNNGECYIRTDDGDIYADEDGGDNWFAWQWLYVFPENDELHPEDVQVLGVERLTDEQRTHLSAPPL